MSGYRDRMYEPAPAFTPEKRPSFYDLQDNAEAGIIKRGITRYFTTRNYERSIKIHTFLGSPLIRKAVMGTVGRLSGSGIGGNYRLDSSKSKIEAATNFAYRGSVYNEVLHTVCGLPVGSVAAADIVEGKYGTGFVASALAAGCSFALVALQRYNRARAIKRVDEQLAEGATFRADYRNWSGIDAAAVENYRQALGSHEAGQTPLPSHSIGSTLPYPEVL